MKRWGPCGAPFAWAGAETCGSCCLPVPGVAFNSPDPPNLPVIEGADAAEHGTSECPAAEVPAVCPAPLERPAEHRKRARKPAGTAEGGEFQGDDPATPGVDEAWES